VCVLNLCVRDLCVRDVCMSVWLLLFGFRSGGMGVDVLLACFLCVFWFLCLEVVSFGFFCGCWACFCLLICELYVLWGLIVRCVCVCLWSRGLFE